MSSGDTDQQPVLPDGSAARLWWFLSLVIALSGPVYFWHAHSTSPGAGAYIRWLMWCPGLAALLAIRLTGGQLSSIGWTWPTWRMVVLSVGIPFAYVTATFAVAWTLRGGFPSEEFLSETRASFWWPALPSWAVIVAYLVVNSVGRVVTDTATALGEEIGWRGLLSPLLTARLGFAGGSLLAGLVWSAWHLPLIFLRNPINAENLLAAACLTTSLTGVGFAMSHLRRASNSVWTAALFHSAHNVFGFAGLAMSHQTPALAPLLEETGLVMPIVGVIVAVLTVAIHIASARRRDALVADRLGR